MKSGKLSIIIIGILFIALASFTLALPAGSTIKYLGNETSTRSGIATAESNTSIMGGTIATLLLTARQQNDHYKAYVGNVTGLYVLEDANNFSIYEWTLGTVAGEVYVTRKSSSVNWGDVECANLTHITTEMSNMHHNITNTPYDGINTTFDDEANDHWGFWAGQKSITPNSCNYSINPYVNDSMQTDDLFEEVVLYDGSSSLIYVGEIEDNRWGFKNDSVTTYDFQMIIPENGSPSDSHTTYYFYVELS